MSWLEDESEVVTRVTSVVPTALPADAAERNALVEKAWQGLRGKQQNYLQSLRQHNFNRAATLRAMEKSGDGINRVTVYKWEREDPEFRTVLAAMKAVAREELVDPDNLLLRAEDIAEQAMEGNEIFDKEGKVVGHRKQLDIALRANEQLMRTQKMLGNDQEDKVFGGRSLTLVVQVVQPDGTLKDVTPAGVVIDVPSPDWLTDEG